MQSLIDIILTNIVYQKYKSLQMHGVESTLTVAKARRSWGKAASNLAEMCEKWVADPKVLVDAAWSYAKASRCPDGPMPNMLGSEKYIRKAVAHYLQLPSEAATHQLSRDYVAQRALNFHKEQVVDIRKCLKDGGDIRFLTSVPALNRFIYLGDLNFLRANAADIMREVESDPKTEILAECLGWSYKNLARAINSG